MTPGEIGAVERVARSEGSDLAGKLHGWIIEKLREALRAETPSEVGVIPEGWSSRS